MRFLCFLISLGATALLRKAQGVVACWDCVENGGFYKVVYGNVVPSTSCVQHCTNQTNFLSNMTQCLSAAKQCAALPMSMANTTIRPDYPEYSCFAIDQCSECKENDNCTFLMDTQGSARCVPKGFVTGPDTKEVTCHTGACYDCTNYGMIWRTQIDKTGITTACVSQSVCSEVNEIVGFTRCLTDPSHCNSLPIPTTQSEGHHAHSPDSCFLIPDVCNCDIREDCVGLQQVAKDDSTGELTSIAKQCYPKHLLPSGEGVKLERCEWNCVDDVISGFTWLVAYAPYSMYANRVEECTPVDRVFGVALCIDRPSSCAAVPDGQGMMIAPPGTVPYFQYQGSCFAHTEEGCYLCSEDPNCLWYEDVDGNKGCKPKGFVTSANIWPTKCEK